MQQPGQSFFFFFNVLNKYCLVVTTQPFHDIKSKMLLTSLLQTTNPHLLHDMFKGMALSCVEGE